MSFTKDEGSGNSYTATFTIEPINSFKTKTFISNKKYGSTGNAGSGTTNNRTQLDKTSGGQTLKYGHVDLPNIEGKATYNQILKYAKDKGYALVRQSGNPVYLFAYKDSVRTVSTYKSDRKTKLSVLILTKDTVPAYGTSTGYGSYIPKTGVHVDWNSGTITYGKTSYVIEYYPL